MYIQISNLTKKIGKITVLENIDLRMESGKIHGFQGKNGSGKTMLMRAICGLINPTEGYVDINGEILGKKISFPKSIGVLIENPGFIPSYTGFNNLKILAEIKNKIDDEQIVSILTELGIGDVKDKKVKTYSLGMKQKLGIAAAVMENSDIIVLDEPLNGLDEKSVDVVKKIISKRRDEGALVIISCHDREELEYLSDEIYSIEIGKIISHRIIKNEDKVICNV